MTIEVNPVGVQCNLSCPYCYEHPIRDAGYAKPDAYDLEAMKRTLAAQGGAFTLFGGEALLMPFDDLEDLVRWGAAHAATHGGGNIGIQTNGTLITEQHVKLFTECGVHVGISLDGPDELNDTRWAGSVEKTREMTRRTDAAIRMLSAAGHPPSLILTLHRKNCSPAAMPKFIAWLRELHALGVRSIRLHLMEIDHRSVESLALSREDLHAALEALMELTAETKMRDLDLDLFREMVRLLRGQDQNVSCVWHSCDPFTTSAVNGVAPDGSRQNCGRVEKDGIQWRKADFAFHERQLSLYTTPQADGGCQDCRFFSMCRGSCPGDAIEGDWRLRSANCETLMWMFEKFEHLLSFLGETPISAHPKRREIEQHMMTAWAAGKNISLDNAVQYAVSGTACDPANYMCDGHGDKHGDHTDAPGTVAHGDRHGDHLDVIDDQHGDRPHGDLHGDHTDTRRRQ